MEVTKFFLTEFGRIIDWTLIMTVSIPTRCHYSNRLSEQEGIIDVSEKGSTKDHNRSSPPKPVRRLAEAPWSQEPYHQHKPIQNLQNSQQVKLFKLKYMSPSFYNWMNCETGIGCCIASRRNQFI